jgi:hypothetical protein
MHVKLPDSNTAYVLPFKEQGSRICQPLALKHPANFDHSILDGRTHAAAKQIAVA